MSGPKNKKGGMLKALHNLKDAVEEHAAPKGEKCYEDGRWILNADAGEINHFSASFADAPYVSVVAAMSIAVRPGDMFRIKVFGADIEVYVDYVESWDDNQTYIAGRRVNNPSPPWTLNE